MAVQSSILKSARPSPLATVSRNSSRPGDEGFGLSRIRLIGDGSRHERGPTKLTIPPEIAAEMTPAVRAFVELLLNRIETLEAEVAENSD
jgi:hypothetical protein